MGGFLRRLAVASAVAVLAGYVATIALQPGGDWVRVVQDVFPFVVPLVAGSVCLAAVPKMAAESRATWILLGLGALAWGLGDAGFSILEVLGHTPGGTLSLADVGYLALIPFWGAALIVHPSRSRRGFDRVGTSLDALTVLVAAAAVTTAYVLIPDLRTAENQAGAIVALSYPVGDLALLAVFVATVARSRARMRSGDMFLALAIVTFVLGDIFFARLVLIDRYNVGHPVDLTWTAAFVALVLGVSHGLAVRESETRPAPKMPLLAFAGMAGMLLLVGLATIRREGQIVLLAGAVTAGALAVVRLVILIFDRGRLVRSLDAKIEELNEAQTERERFIATVSHDLRSPLTAIGGFASLLREPDIQADAQQVEELTAAIARSTKRLARLTDDLLLAGQFATGHPPELELERVDLRRAAEFAASDSGRGDRVQVHGRWAYATADTTRVQQVLINLLDNAFKHSDPSTPVTITVKATDEGATFEVADQGSGIEPERMETLFDAFVTDRSTRTSVGLGLYVVQNLVRAMDGRISVTSELGRGTIFRVVLPSAPPLVAVEPPASGEHAEQAARDVG